MGFRTRVNALYTPEQTVLMMAPWSLIAPGKDVHGCSRKEVGNEEGWPCKREGMDAEEFRNDERV